LVLDLDWFWFWIGFGFGLFFIVEEGGFSIGWVFGLGFD
jgi:hypothetical protein